ncbi:putative methanogenesis marker protein 2 [Methanolinea mesophila]|uniref:methanogenesis marker 2 protein n=1 Tax=Methanolinea mesophila TaxID=547055 RepID=UPI001AE29CC3|nr:methanogenesis marker 2 protein [Methanolinea mesophila]MBP1929884.1 putative methanogenesis marker protein 2 [Methanolinea mesophila]
MAENSCSTAKIALVVREYEGVKRKRAIGEMVRAIRTDSPGVIASFGEDAAVIEHGDEALLLAADGIWSRLMEADPYWAGYCSVLVNIHDIAAMGGRPIAMVDVFSISDTGIQKKVIAGMHDASLQFGVPIVGGHLHPDTPYSVIDVAILGTVGKKDVIFSHTAQAGDHVVVAVDLTGRVHPSCLLNWDSVTMKTAEQVRAQIKVLEDLGRAHLVTAGKDISNPGVIGTLGMLLEVSGKGACIDLDAIPRPDLKANHMTFEQWVRIYPGMGFVLTVTDDNLEEVVERFRKVGMIARSIGTVNTTRELAITYHDEHSSVFDFSHNGIMHLTSEDESCRP